MEFFKKNLENQGQLQNKFRNVKYDRQSVGKLLSKFYEKFRVNLNNTRYSY